MLCTPYGHRSLKHLHSSLKYLLLKLQSGRVPVYNKFLAVCCIVSYTLAANEHIQGFEI
jgi:hypothetical protein